MLKIHILNSAIMKKHILIGITLAILFTQCSLPASNREPSFIKGLNTQLPKVLFITTGLNFKDQNPDLADGINVAIQTFNKRGILVRLEPRDVLLNYDFLRKYNIIVLATSLGYHDADRKFSLTYMSDPELKNLTRFVEIGGLIIAGDNVGRNNFDGTDRIKKNKSLNPKNYPLSRAFGAILKEKNMKGYSIIGEIDSTLSGELLPPSDENLLSLVQDRSISYNKKTLAYWVKKSDSIPAITQNNFGKGIAFLLASSKFLTPTNVGGYWSVNQIQTFYNYVADEFYRKNNITMSLNPWPNAHDMAFCITFNPIGNLKNYQYVYNQLKDLDIKATYFVDGIMNDSIKDFLKTKKALIESTGYDYRNYKSSSFSIIQNDILLNENKWAKKFNGFRFPFTSPDFNGLITLDLQDYKFESSISINNVENIHGSVFPYNIVLAHDKFYKSTNILEIAPAYRDDFFFLNRLIDKSYINPNQLHEDVSLYEHYLQDFWEYNIKPHHGLLVYSGHPGLVGHNYIPFTALLKLIAKIKRDDTWITSINEIATFRKNLEKFSFHIKNNFDTYTIYVEGPNNITIKDITINLDKKPKRARAENGRIAIHEKDKCCSIVFDAFNGQVITLVK